MKALSSGMEWNVVYFFFLSLYHKAAAGAEVYLGQIFQEGTIGQITLDNLQKTMFLQNSVFNSE